LKTDTFLAAGVHIGTLRKMRDMERFVYKMRPDGLYVLDIQAIEERLKQAGQFITKFEPSKVLVVAGREYAQAPAKKFAELIGAQAKIGRYMPGTMTNPNLKDFVEPVLLIASDPLIDKQAIKEAGQINIPTVVFCDSNNQTGFVDLILPGNNKGRKSLATLFWALTTHVLRARGTVAEDAELDLTADDFLKK